MTTFSFYRTPIRPTLLAVGILTAAACSSSGGGTGASTTTTTGKGGSGTTSTGTTSSTSTVMTCPPGMTYGGGEMKKAGGSVTAKIVDEKGAPIAAGQPVYICGIDICSDPSTTDANGSVTITTTLMMKKPAFKFGDTISYAELAIPLTMATTDFTGGGTKVLQTGKLSDKTGAALTAGKDATSGDVTISIPAGASVAIDALTYDTPDKQLFRATSVPITNDAPVFVSSGKTDFALLYAVAPVETTICPAAKVTVALPHATMMPNDLGWAAGDAVEFWVMTTDVAQTYAPYAGWAKMSGGTVSADGKSVTSTEGFVLLENFAIRKAN